MRIINNQLHISKIKATDIAKKYGTPLYVYNQQIIEQKITKLKRALVYPKSKIYYACKANSNPNILKIMLKQGLNLDAVSPGEIFLALRVGFKPKQIIFTVSNASDEDFLFAIKNKILTNLDSISQIEKYGKLNPGAKVSLRINLNIGEGHHDYCITGGLETKFGIYYTKLDEAKETAKKYKLKIIGLHSHIGSGILSEEKYLSACQALLRVAKNFTPHQCGTGLEFLDFGGGLGIPHRPKDRPLDIKRLGRKISFLFSEFCQDYGRNLVLIIEPGRYLVAQSGFLLTKITAIKSTPKCKFIGTDTGFNHLIRPALYRSYHKIIKVDGVKSKKEESVVVAGNLCEMSDIFTLTKNGKIDRRPFPYLSEGDILAILDVGAYGFSLSSNYNSRLLPAEVLVKNNDTRLIRRRQEFKDLLRQNI